MTEYKLFREKIRILEMKLKLLNKEGGCCCSHMSLEQCHTLVEIGREQSLSLKVLASRLGLIVSTVSRVVENLVKKGYVFRRVSEVDRRSIEIQLTQSGMVVFNDIEAKMDKKFEKIFNYICDDEKSNVNNAIEIIINAISNEECNCNNKKAKN